MVIMSDLSLMGNRSGVPRAMFSYLIADSHDELLRALRNARVPIRRVIQSSKIPMACVKQSEHSRLLRIVDSIQDIMSFSALAHERIKDEWAKK